MKSCLKLAARSELPAKEIKNLFESVPSPFSIGVKLLRLAEPHLKYENIPRLS